MENGTTTTASVHIPIRLEQQQQSQQQPHPQQPSPLARPSVMERLRQLEAEMSVEAVGLRLPPDPELTDKLSAFLAAQHPDADLQITVSSVRRTTTTKQQFETETPGMVGLPAEKLMELQRKLMQKISANIEPAKAAGQDDGEEKSKAEEEEWARRGPADVKRTETVEESGGTDAAADGSNAAAAMPAQWITKKLVHTETTSQSRAQGLDDLVVVVGNAAAAAPPPPSAPPPTTTTMRPVVVEDGFHHLQPPPSLLRPHPYQQQQQQQQQQRTSTSPSVAGFASSFSPPPHATNGIEGQQYQQQQHQEKTIPIRRA